LKTKAIRYFQTDRTLTRIVSPPLYNNKKIEAIICKTQFEDVKEALLEAKIEWLSYCNVKGIGKTCQGRI